jgi:hypothetical protein
LKYCANQKGISAILITIVAAVIIGVAGVAVYRVQRSRSAEGPAATTSNPSSPADDSAANQSPAQSAPKFVVKELGIQFMLTDSIRDLKYVVKTANGHTFARFSTTSLEAADRNTGGSRCTADVDGPLGGIDLGPTPIGERAIKTIGNQTLNFAHAQAPCSRDAGVVQLAGSQSDAFVQALATAEAVQ